MKYNLFTPVPERYRHIPQQPLPPVPQLVIPESVQLAMLVEPEYEVKCIEADRVRDGIKEFKVQWTNSSEKTWEPEKNLSDCKVSANVKINR